MHSVAGVAVSRATCITAVRNALMATVHFSTISESTPVGRVTPASEIPNLEEHIMHGNTSHLPKLPSKTVKIYLSSGYHGKDLMVFIQIVASML